MPSHLPLAAESCLAKVEKSQVKSKEKAKKFGGKVTIHSRPKPVKWKTKEIIFCLKANQRLSGRCDLSGC